MQDVIKILSAILGVIVVYIVFSQANNSTGLVGALSNTLVTETKALQGR